MSQRYMSRSIFACFVSLVSAELSPIIAMTCHVHVSLVSIFFMAWIWPMSRQDFSSLSLEKRRTLASLTECYKTINGLNCLSQHEFFSFAENYRPLRSNHRFKLKTKSAKLNCYKHFFLRIVNLWNNLRKETAEAKDLRSFSNKLANEFSWNTIYINYYFELLSYKYTQLYIVLNLQMRN